MPKARHPQSASEAPSPPASRAPRHLAACQSERAITEFEQGLLCASEAFFRFYGAILGREGRQRGVSGQDNVILQQIMAAGRPLSVSDIARFANRDDTANIQYSLKKLVRAGLVEKARRSSARETAYRATDLARAWTEDFVRLRRELFTGPSGRIKDLDEHLAAAGALLNTLAGLYDHGTRVMSGLEQRTGAGADEDSAPETDLSIKGSGSTA